MSVKIIGDPSDDHDIAPKSYVDARSVARVDVSTGSETRPTAHIVLWVGGTTKPTNFDDDTDIWFAYQAATPPSIITSSINTFTATVAFTQTLSAAGSSPLTWSVDSGAFPTGVSLSSGGVVSGTPTTAGAWSVTVKVSNGSGEDTKTYSGTTAAAPTAPVIDNLTLNSMTQDSSFSQNLVADSGTTPITWTKDSGTLPAGLSLSSSGVLAGTPTASGDYTFVIKATNDYGSDTKSFTVTVAEPSGGRVEHNIMGSTAQDAAYSGDNSDGGSTSWMGTQFYITASPARSWYVVGVRIYAKGGMIGKSGKVGVARSAVADGGIWMVGDLIAAAPWSNGTAVNVGPLVAGWNDFYLDTPVPMNSLDGMIAAYGLAGWYGYDANHPASSAIQSHDGVNLYMSENGTTTGTDGIRSFYAASEVAGFQRVQSANSYGIDIIVAETAS